MTALAPQLGNPDHRPMMTRKDSTAPFLIRLEGIPATQENLERMRQHVEDINRRLSESNTPFRVKLI